jgi:hypothetical protein
VTSRRPTLDQNLAALVPRRLAEAPEVALPASVDDEAHRFVVHQALEWQQVAGSASFWEMAAITAVEGMAYALAGQIGAAGEQLALAYAAGVAVALWRERRRQLEPADVETEMCMRAMAEGQTLFVTGTGHAFANVGLRSLTMDEGLRALLIEKYRRRDGSAPTFDPFSTDVRNWLSLNCDNAVS